MNMNAINKHEVGITLNIKFGFGAWSSEIEKYKQIKMANLGIFVDFESISDYIKKHNICVL